MSYYSSISGGIEIQPPLTWGEVKASGLPTECVPGVSLCIRVDIRHFEDYQGDHTIKTGVAVINAWLDRELHRAVDEELRVIVAKFPGHQFIGELVRRGENAGDIERYYVDCSSTPPVVVVERAVVSARWPDGSPVDLEA